MAASTGLAVLLASLGDVLEGTGSNIEKRDNMVQQYGLRQQMDVLNRPYEEEQFRRKLFLTQGIDPNTGQPIPGYLEAIKNKRAAMRGGGGGGGKKSSDEDDVVKQIQNMFGG